MSSDKPSCFVIMPFSVRDHDLEKYNGDSNHWNEVYEGLIEPAVEASGMRVERDDKDFSSRLVAEGIWKKIEASDVVLCDLSSLNPNVYLELGWALRADKKFVLIKDEHTDFSFDLNQFHTCVYSSRLKPSSLKADVRTLTRAIKETVSDEDRQYSVVKRLSLKYAIESTEEKDINTRMLEVLSNKLDSLEFFKFPTYRKNRELQASSSSDSNRIHFTRGDIVQITNVGKVLPSLHETKIAQLLDHTQREHMNPDNWGDWQPENGLLVEIVMYVSNPVSIKEKDILVVRYLDNYIGILSNGVEHVMLQEEIDL